MMRLTKPILEETGRGQEMGEGRGGEADRRDKEQRIGSTQAGVPGGQRQCAMHLAAARASPATSPPCVLVEQRARFVLDLVSVAVGWASAGHLRGSGSPVSAPPQAANFLCREDEREERRVVTTCTWCVFVWLVEMI